MAAEAEVMMAVEAAAVKAAAAWAEEVMEEGEAH